MIPLREIFKVEYGNSLELNSLKVCSEHDEDAINFVSRTRENNGISAIVKRVDDIEPFEAGLITVAGSGNSVLESFIQPKPFYTGYHVFILRPKKKLTVLEQLYYCYCIRQNQYKYSYGRQANRTLKELLLPSADEIPDWVYNGVNVEPPSKNPVHTKQVSIRDREWIYFNLIDYFKMSAGKYYPTSSYTEGRIPLVSSTNSNNGIKEFTDLEPRYNTPCLTIGKISASTFVQTQPFVASPDVTVLAPRDKKAFNVFIGVFIATIINQEAFKWSYGRQIRLNDSKKLRVKLPATKEGKPDWQFMEYYIKSLPYSSNLVDEMKKETKKQGLSDKELIAKYEAGEVNMAEAASKMLSQKPSDTKAK